VGDLLWLLALLSLIGILQLHAAKLPEAAIAAHYADNIRHYGSADGLPQNSVNAIVQSQAGYLWLGTYGGLTRFDGTRFTLFRSLAQQGPSSDRILSLLEDAQQHLWIGTEDAGISACCGTVVSCAWRRAMGAAGLLLCCSPSPAFWRQPVSACLPSRALR